MFLTGILKLKFLTADMFLTDLSLKWKLKNSSGHHDISTLKLTLESVLT